MSGFIDKNGVQWEHCTLCSSSTRLDDLGYVKPSPAHPHGLDICVECANAAVAGGEIPLHNIQLAPLWGFATAN